MFRFKEYRFRYLSIRLILFVSILSVIGILVIGSATGYDGNETRQAISFAVAFVMMLLLSLIDYHFILKFYWLIYAFHIGLLLLVKVIGESGGGSQRWIRFGGGIGIQPSEVAKICIILFLAKLIEKFYDKLNSFRFLCLVVALFGFPFVLILTQPDLSSSLVFFSLCCSIIFLAGLSYWYIGSVLLISIPSLAFILYKVLQPGQTLINNYQKNRLLGFLYQDSSAAEIEKRGLDISLITSINYQQKNSILAIGSGQLTGKGLANNTVSSVKNGNFLSEPQTDFIFAIVGEELGFAGALAVIVLLLLIALECMWIAKNAKDWSGKLIAGGMGALIFIQGFINIGVATWILPNTGLTLPFVSYGMSSLMSLMIGIGVVLNVALQRELTFKEVLYNDDL